METSCKEAQLILAIQAMKNDPKLTLRGAAKVYGVSHATLLRRQKGTASRRDSPPNSQKLTLLEEEAIIERILDMDSRCRPPRLHDVEDMANLLLTARGAPRVGVNWSSNFIKRQPALKTRRFRKYDYKRSQCEDPDAINAWFRLVRNTVAKYGITDADIFNFDETGFQIGVISSGTVVTSSERRSNTKLVQPGNRQWVTVIQGVNAMGWYVPPFIVVAGKFHLSSWYEETPLPNDWVIATSPNGWTTNEIGLEWIQHFDKYTKSQKTGRYRLLILDGHESHHSVEFEIYCKDNNIITLCMPPHSSHLLQPLDVGCFGPLKQAYGRQIEDKMRAGTSHITKEDFFPAFFAAFQLSITKKNIQGGFRGSGLVPYSPEAVLSKLDVKLKTPTPPRTSHRDAEVWTCRTPNNPMEATSQSEYIKNRVARHQNSSPTSILGAVDQLAKGTRTIMHRMALMESDVQHLRGELETLSKRRRAKKTQLRQGGSLSVAEAQDLQAQNDVNVQVKEETQQRSGRAPRSETKKRRCGVCGNTGHNARTCQVVISLSEEDDEE